MKTSPPPLNLESILYPPEEVTNVNETKIVLKRQKKKIAKTLILVILILSTMIIGLAFFVHLILNAPLAQTPNIIAPAQPPTNSEQSVNPASNKVLQNPLAHLNLLEDKEPLRLTHSGDRVVVGLNSANLEIKNGKLTVPKQNDCVLEYASDFCFTGVIEYTPPNKPKTEINVVVFKNVTTTKAFDTVSAVKPVQIPGAKAAVYGEMRDAQNQAVKIVLLASNTGTGYMLMLNPGVDVPESLAGDIIFDGVK